MKRLLAFAVALFSLASTLSAQAPKRELRSVWFTTYYAIDWPSNRGTSASVQAKQKADLIEYLDNFDRRNFTGICFQVRSLCDAMYKSSYEPWSVYISGKRGTDPGWDPLAFAVEECHKRGLECWAWVNPFRQRLVENNFDTPQDRELAERGLLLSYKSSSSFYCVMNPGLQEARDYIIDVCKEIYTNYSIDGMLFDDYFYPNNIPENSSAGDYNLWLSSGSTLSFGDWRRENINQFMRELSEQIGQDRPDMRFGVSPAGVAYLGAYQYGFDRPNVSASDWQYGTIYSDPAAWLHDGSIDFISPQIYWPTTSSAAPYGPLCSWWSDVANHFGRHFYSSQGSYRVSDGTITNDEAGWGDMAKQVEYNRLYTKNGAPGSIYYSAKYFDGPTCTGMGQYLYDHCYQTKSLNPVIDWKERTPYDAPTDVVCSDGTLRWSATAGHRDNSIIRYTVYAVPESVTLNEASLNDGDGIDPRYLLDVCYSTSYQLPSDKLSGHWYAVCVYDGYGYESEAAICGTPAEYVPLTENTVYPSVDTFSLTNLWYRSVDEGFANITFLNDGQMNRGMAVADGVVYISSRDAASASANLALWRYDLMTGENLGNLNLSEDGQMGFYPCNDVISDDAGNILITNLILKNSNTPLTLMLVDTKTGSLTKVVEVAGAGSCDRFDHCAVRGDVTSGTFDVYAAGASTTNLYRWTVENGEVTNVTTASAKKFSPASASNFGIAPRVLPVGENLVWVDGASTMPALYDLTDGSMVDTFASASEAAPSSYAANGLAWVSMRDRNMFVYPCDDHTSATGFRWAISSAAEAKASTLSRMWSFPENGIGKINSTTCSAPCAAVALGNGSTVVTVLSPGNGLAAYLISDTGSTTSMPVFAGEEAPSWRVSGRTVVANCPITAYNLSGIEVGRSDIRGRITFAAPGTYIIAAAGRVGKVTVK